MNTTIADTYKDYLALTDGNSSAAATLVVATMYSSAKPQIQERQAIPDDEYMTVKEAAQEYRLSARTVYRMVSQGLPTLRAGKAIRIKRKDMARWLSEMETRLH